MPARRWPHDTGDEAGPGLPGQSLLLSRSLRGQCLTSAWLSKSKTFNTKLKFEFYEIRKNMNFDQNRKDACQLLHNLDNPMLRNIESVPAVFVLLLFICAYIYTKLACSLDPVNRSQLSVFCVWWTTATPQLVLLFKDWGDPVWASLCNTDDLVSVSQLSTSVFEWTAVTTGLVLLFKQ